MGVHFMKYLFDILPTEFFKPLTSRYRREYADCIMLLLNSFKPEIHAKCGDACKVSACNWKQFRGQVVKAFESVRGGIKLRQGRRDAAAAAKSICPISTKVHIAGVCADDSSDPKNWELWRRCPGRG